MLNHHNQMGKVDCCSLCRCGIRMNGVLIERISWLGFFYYFHFLHVRTCHTIQKPYLQKCCIPYYNSAVGIQVTWIKLDRKKNEYPI